MIVADAQRWRSRLASYRPAGEVIEPRRYEVAAIGDDATARAFVVAHHYSGSYPAARERVGLYRAGELVGVAVFSRPGQARVLDALPCDAATSVELGRFVLLDSVPGNGESWFLARAIDLLRRDGYEGIVTHADPEPRAAADGAVVLPGHRGVIYQAASAVYTGRTRARTLWMLPDGTIYSEQAWSKLRRQVRGWRYALDQLVAAGAAPWDGREPTRVWALRELHRIGRPFRHHGNHRYLIPISRACRRALPGHLAAVGLQVQPYPRAAALPPIARAA